MIQPTCINCRSTDKTILVAQERRVFGRLCTWQICPSCKSAYDETSALIRREQEAKALGRTQHGKSATPKKPTNDHANQGVLA